MPRLIWVFAGRTHHFVGFVVLRLMSVLNKNNSSVRNVCPVFQSLNKLNFNASKQSDEITVADY